MKRILIILLVLCGVGVASCDRSCDYDEVAHHPVVTWKTGFVDNKITGTRQVSIRFVAQNHTIEEIRFESLYLSGVGEVPVELKASDFTWRYAAGEVEGISRTTFSQMYWRLSPTLYAGKAKIRGRWYTISSY